MITVKINNKEYQTEPNKTILDVCIENNIKVPTLCYLKDVNKSGSCRVCLVEVKGARTLCSACTYPVRDGLEVLTNSAKAIAGRKCSVELLLSNHSKDCLSCSKNQKCELQKVSEELGIREAPYQGEMTPKTVDEYAVAIQRDPSKCILCGRCIETCKKFQGLGILGFMNRGFKAQVGPLAGKSFMDVNCMQCGQCVLNCPTAALSVKEDTQKVIDALNDPDKFVIVQTAPAVRAALGEEFGLPIGTRVTGKMVKALKVCGFNRVYDTNFAADLTIMEEGTEFINRVQNGGVLPMITSCSPGWVRYCEYEYPDILSHLSTCKSPHMMFGALAKSYFAEKHNLKPEDIYVVSIMPCSAKKLEIIKPELQNKNGVNDVDCVLTTRECAQLIKTFGIDLNSLEDDQFDQDLFGEYTGAGVIFGATGGVMEAALRTVAEKLTGKEIKDVDYTAVRGLEGVKEATLNINGMDVKVAISSSMAATKPLLDDIRDGKSPYHFIEVMGCPGGCINGGGQPFVSADVKNKEGFDAYRQKRANALYEEDKLMPKRKSHENEQIIQLYKEYLGEPNSHKAHELLHTTYSKKERFK